MKLLNGDQDPFVLLLITSQIKDGVIRAVQSPECKDSLLCTVKSSPIRFSLEFGGAPFLIESDYVDWTARPIVVARFRTVSDIPQAVTTD